MLGVCDIAGDGVTVEARIYDSNKGRLQRIPNKYQEQVLLNPSSYKSLKLNDAL